MRSIDAIWDEDEAVYLGSKFRCMAYKNGKPHIMFYDNITQVYKYFKKGILIFACFSNATESPLENSTVSTLNPSRAILLKNGKPLIKFNLVGQIRELISIEYETPRKKLYKITMNYKGDYCLSFESGRDKKYHIIAKKDKGIKPPVHLRSYSYYDKIFQACNVLLEEHLYAIH